MDKVDEISSISGDEYINLVSTFTSLYNADFNCSQCKRKYPKQPDKLEKHRKRLGCDGSVDPKLVYKPTHNMTSWPKILYSKCIGNFFDFRAMNLINYFHKYNKNAFPYKGSYYEQPNKFIEVMDLIGSLLSQDQAEKEEKLKKYKR